MGCSASSEQIYMTDGDNDIGSDAVASDAVVGPREWRMFLSAAEARRKFEAERSMPVSTRPGHLELRALLEEPTSFQMVLSFAQEKGRRQVIACWATIQGLCSVPASKAYDNAKTLYQKYLRKFPPELARLIVLTPAEEALRIDCCEYFEESDPAVVQLRRRDVEEPNSAELEKLRGMFRWLQLKCFQILYDQVFMLFKVSPQYREMTAMLKHRYNDVQPDDFEYLSKLGNGAFGVVVKCRKKSTGMLYAMKIQRKKALMEHFDKEPWRINDEKKAYAACAHPFVVEFHYAFQTRSLAIVVMGLITRGDLHELLSSEPGGRLQHKYVHFYCAEVVSALTFLHRLDLIYRDLKPGNVLLHEDGHVRLADLGAVVDVQGGTIGQYDETDNMAPIFRKFGGKGGNVGGSMGGLEWSCTAGHNSHGEYDGPVRAKSIVGTFGYMAPEVLVQCSQPPGERVGYTHAVDWWSLGATMYKLYMGDRPFETVDKTKPNKPRISLVPSVTHKKRADGVTFSCKPDGPSGFGMSYDRDVDLFAADTAGSLSPDARDFITRLLDFDEEKRLGGCATGEAKAKATAAEMVLKHPYFKDVDWKKLEARQLTPPPLPPRLDKVDTVTTSSEAADFPPTASLVNVLSRLGCAQWLSEAVTEDEEPYFTAWDFSSNAAIRNEITAASQCVSSRGKPPGVESEVVTGEASTAPA